jgi:hypothetical protein
MSDWEFLDIQIFQHSGKGIPLFMIDHKNCLQSDYLFGPGPRLIKKKNLPGRGLTNVEKYCCIHADANRTRMTDNYCVDTLLRYSW